MRTPTNRPAPRRNSRRARIASVTAVAVAVATLGVFASRSLGSTVHEADLGDGGIWLSSDALSRFGRINKAVGQFDAGVAADVQKGSSIDVLQDGAAVLTWAQGTQQLQAIDARTSTTNSATAVVPAQAPVASGLQPTTVVDLRGGTVAIVEEKTGKVWAQRVDPRTGIDDLGRLGGGSKPIATVGGRASLAVGVDGAVHVASGEKGTVTTIAPIGSAFGVPTTTKDVAKGQGLQVSAVGDEWLVYDPTTDLLHSADHVAGVEAGLATDPDQPAYALLQQPGPAADAAAIATTNAVRMVNLSGGTAPGGIEVQERVNRSAEVPHLTAPVSLKGCIHGAWREPGKVFYGANCGVGAPVPTGTLEALSEDAIRQGVRFRVNRDLIVLNDMDTGAAWDVDNDQKKIDNWDSLIPPPEMENDNDKKDKNLVDDAVLEQPPTATDDHLKVRPGRTTKLHVLDNDTDVAGAVLAIDPADVGDASDERVRPQVSGDGQTIDVAVPKDLSGSFTFTYMVNNGKVKSAKANVTVTVVGAETNSAPHLREGATQAASTAYPVLVGKRISLPVLADWRDDEGDTLSLAASEEGLSVDGQGRLEYLAGVTAGVQSIPYAVSDGRTEGTSGAVEVEVIALTDGRPRNPVTQPDVVRGVVGKPIQIEPLGNDVPGADPGDPDADLRLAGDVRSIGSLTVDTNRDTGVVTVTPAAAGSQVLSYAAQSGSGIAPGRIRVDVVAEADPNAPPIAVSDAGTLRGQLSTMVDVLANDYSPRGDVLVTQSVSIDAGSEWIEASIYQGRWVRLRSLESAGAAAGVIRGGVVTYAVSDGTHTARGQIEVVQKPVQPITPVVRDDRALVREGDAVTIPVLDNDTMADGIPLRLDPSSVHVLDGRPQTAFASDNVVRFVPTDTGLTGEQHVTIEYAAHPEGDPQRAQTGRIAVTVVPLPTAARPNQAPVARSFTTSVTAGDPLTITVPTSGVDPDGDTVSIRGIVGAEGAALDLRLGRIVSVGADTIRYEAYPTASGTEIIDYEVADRFGELSRGFVRVGVVAPGDAQPPVAVDDTVTAMPGKTVHVPVLQNDLIARGDAVNLSLGAGAESDWKIDEQTRQVSTRVPEETAALHQVVYQIDNGAFDPSRATLLVRGQKDHLNPPIAKDDVAVPKPGEDTALVDVLANDFDIDSDPNTLRIDAILGVNGEVVQTPEGPKVQVKILDHGYTVPYVIVDEDGAKGMALIHVPTGSKGKPYVIPATLIQMDTDSTKSVTLADHVKSPQGRTLGIAAANTLSASPAGQLTVTANGSDGLTLTSSGGYVGPGAVTLEVSDQMSADQQDVNTAFVTIPVQVGPRVPLLRCPTSAITLNAGGLERQLDIPTLCRAWLPQGMTMDEVTFTASWKSEPAGVDLSLQGDGDRLAVLSAGTRAPSGEGVLTVGVQGGTTSGEVRVIVVGGTEAPIPPPRLRPMSIAGLREGESQTIDVASALDSPLANPQCAVGAAMVSSGTALTATHSGCQVTVTAGKAPSPTGTVEVTVSDGPGRTASGTIDVTMLGKPGAPTAVSAQADREAGGRARVSWIAPTYDGGSPIRTYTVRWTGGSTGQLACTASPCTIEGLENGKDYTFVLTATNAVGEGDPSAPSNVARPDTKPGPVPGVTMVSRGDGLLNLSWQTPDNKGSAIVKYTVRLIPTDGSGAARTVEVAAPSLTTTVSGLNNETEYAVAAQAWNELGAGPFGPSTNMQSAGTPPAVAAPRLTPGGLGPTADQTTVDLTWSATRPNGPPLTGYTVHRRTGGGAWQTLATVSANTFSYRDTVAVDGSRHDYVVTATNGANLESPKNNPASFTSVGQPANPSVSASTPQPDQTATLVVSLGNPHSTGYQTVRWTSSAGGGGTINCTPSNCPAGGQLTIRTGAQPLTNQTFTVIANNGTMDSSPASAAANPYGPTPTPTNGGASGSGQNVNYTWSLPTAGRPITRVVITGDFSYDGAPRTSFGASGLQWSTTYSIQVRAYSDAGASAGTLALSARTDPAPLVLRVQHGTKLVNTALRCYEDIPCYEARVTVANFGGTVSCRLTAPSATPEYYGDRDKRWNQPDNSTGDYGGHFGYKSFPTVTVTCSGPNGSRSVTVDWENP